jgi:hypothetical protein
MSTRLLVAICVLACCFSSTIQAQSAPPSRVLHAVDNAVRITLPGNIHPLARPEFDQGEAPANLPMNRMLLVLKRSPEQESALLTLLDSQQDKRSPNYHKWLTPKEFGTRFGPSDSDIAAVTNWLKSSGFQVAEPSAGRTVIEFSGTASQVQASFHTPIHKFVVKGKQHWANASDPQIPAALAPVVAGVHTLHNFLKQPQIAQMKEVPATFSKTPLPAVTFSDGTHALAPLDYQKIYNFPAAFTGTNVTIAVVARSEYSLNDLSEFYSTFGLSRAFPQVIFNGDTPGDLGGNDEGEAILDATWSGALAQGAAVDFVVSASTNTTDGVDLSEIYIIDHNLADVMTESFGSCEANHTSTEANTVGTLAEQAAAEGITYTVSTGDSGAEGCDLPSSASAVGPVSASLLSGTPFNIAVGGTMFHEGTATTFWGPANGPNPTALSHIPENVWNESCSSTQCGSNAALWSGGGGASQFFPKPSWQSGVTGIPNDVSRDQPDVALTAAAHDPYLVCLQNSCSSGQIFFFSGTSAAAPSFAAIMALVDQKTGSRQGQANYVLYRLAAADIAGGRKCNGSATTLPANTCNFNDVTVGNNAVPGEAGFGTSGGKYQSTTGYDLATGLGSVNVTNLVNNWSTVAFTPSTTALVSLSPTTITHGASVNVHVNVTPTAATGDISLRNGDVALSQSGFIDGFTLSGGSVVGTTNLLPGGTYHVIAHYAGDGTYAPSDSTSPGVSVTVNPEASAVALQVSVVDSAGNILPYGTQPFGAPAYLRADVSGASGLGTPRGNLNFRDNGATIGFGNVVNSAGTATTPQGFTGFATGNHSIVAEYQGDNSFSPRNSSPTAITVTQATTTNTISANAAAFRAGAAVSIDASLTTTSYDRGPGGSMTFLVGGVPVNIPGNPAAMQPVNGSLNLQTGASTTATSSAGIVIGVLPVGQNVYSASYSGDANYAASTSTPITITGVADFDFTPATMPITVTRGSSGTVTFTIAGHTGYASTVNFTAASCIRLPTESSCSFSPASVVGSGSTVLSIKTTAPKTASFRPLNIWTAGSGGIFAALFLLGASSRRRRWSAALSVLLFAALATNVACGGGGSSTGPPPDPGTPVGTYNITVNATDSFGVFTHAAVVTMTVQ